MRHAEILYKFLGQRARRFVQRVEDENSYYCNQHAECQPGYFRRDQIRVRLTNIAYRRAGYGFQ